MERDASLFISKAVCVINHGSSTIEHPKLSEVFRGETNPPFAQPVLTFVHQFTVILILKNFVKTGLRV